MTPLPPLYILLARVSCEGDFLLAKVLKYHYKTILYEITVMINRKLEIKKRVIYYILKNKLLKIEHLIIFSR